MKMFLFSAATAVLMTGTASAAELNVSIEGVQAGSGSVLVALQTEEQFLAKDGSYAAVLPADGAMLSATFEDVTAGTYAVAVVHDQDGNGDFTVGDAGPAEGWGLSGAMGPMTGAPDFDSHMVEVTDASAADASVTLTYPN